MGEIRVLRRNLSVEAVDNMSARWDPAPNPPRRLKFSTRAGPRWWAHGYN